MLIWWTVMIVRTRLTVMIMTVVKMMMFLSVRTVTLMKMLMPVR